MHFKFRHLHKIVGGFFLLACILFFVLLAIVAHGERWFQKVVPYTTFVFEAKGIAPAASVMLSGLEVGKVEKVTLDPDNRVRVALSIYAQYADRVREGTETSLSSPIIGSSQVLLLLGDQKNPRIPEGGVIPSKASGDGALDELIASVNKLVKRLEDPEGDLMKSLANLNGLTAKLNKAMADEKGTLYSELHSAVSNLDAVLASLGQSSPDLRDAITEARRGLEETNKVILALQKSIFLRSNIDKYLQEPGALVSEGR